MLSAEEEWQQLAINSLPSMEVDCGWRKEASELLVIEAIFMGPLRVGWSIQMLLLVAASRYWACWPFAWRVHCLGHFPWKLGLGLPLWRICLGIPSTSLGFGL